MEEELKQLRQRVAQLEAKLEEQKQKKSDPSFEKKDQLNNEEIRRFGRQLILPELGPEGQLKLRNSSVLVVGAGGLGAPAILYLGAGGIGKLGIVDHDDVDISNLHRQVIHKERTQGMNKAVSAMLAVHEYVVVICIFI